MFAVVDTLCALITVSLLRCNLVKSDPTVKEYCERESFEAKCGDGEVISIRYAAYGRVRMGRCVRNDYGAIGCSVDVLPRVEALCSGRRECVFPVTDLHVTKPCPNELIAFMEASYDCIKVSPCQRNMCDTGGFLRIAPTSGNLASIITAETGCGSSYCPWVIEPKNGQRLNLTFHNYFTPKHGVRSGGICHRYASVVDRGTKVSKDVTMCGHDNGQVNMLMAPSVAVEIRFFVGDDKQTPPRFLLNYQVIGCPDVTPPAGATMKRDGDLLTISCSTSGRSWHLVCGNTEWVGDIGTCSEGQVWNIGTVLEDASTTPAGILVVVGIGVALGVVMGFTMLAFAIIYMKRKHNRRQYESGDALVPQTNVNSSKMYDTQVTDSDLYCRSYQARGSLPRPNSKPAPDDSDSDTGYPVPSYFKMHDDRREHVYECPQVVLRQSPAGMRSIADNPNVNWGSAAL